MLTVHPRWHEAALAVITIPADAHPIARSARGLITLAHTQGRIVVFDPEQRRIVADLAVHS